MKTCTRCKLPLVAPADVVPDRVYDHAHPPDQCVRLLWEQIHEMVSYVNKAKRAAPERYKYGGRPLPEIVAAMAEDLERS